MDKMVVTFHADGKVEHLLKDKFFKLEGQRSVERVSEILFYEPSQKFYINWLKGRFAGTFHDTGMADFLAVSTEPGEIDDLTGIVLFASYDDAVAHEVAMVNAMRLAGVSFQ